MMNAQSGSRVSITVDGVSSASSVVSGSWIATLTVRAEVLLEEREALHHEREQLVRLDLAENLGRDRAAVRADVRLEPVAVRSP